MSKIVKIGILGGAFSPPTIGHISLAQKVLDQGFVDQIWLSPCYAHNYGKEMIDPEHRIEMCKIAANKDTRISVSEFEIKTKLIGGTLKYINNLRAAFAILNQCCLEGLDYTYQFYFIIGLDNANTYKKWRDYEKLIETIPFIVVSRKGVNRDIDIDWYTKDPHKFLQTVEIPNTSSTEVREIIKSGSKKKDGRLLQLLDDDVRNYIIKNNLYVN